MRSFLHHVEGVDECPGCDDRLKDGDPGIVSWFQWIKMQHPTVHVAWCYRDEENQNQAFASGASKLQWPNSKHNQLPSQAVDLFEQINHKAVFDPIKMAKIDDDSRMGGYIIRWGGHFKTLGDSGHFELQEDKK